MSKFYITAVEMIPSKDGPIKTTNTFLLEASDINMARLKGSAKLMGNERLESVVTYEDYIAMDKKKKKI